MRIAFWNTNRKRINPFIASLVKDYSIDLLVLAEYEDDLDQIEKELEFGVLSSPGCKRIKILTSFPSIKVGPQSSFFSIQIVNDDFILCGLHLPSKCYDFNGDRRGLVIDQLLKDLGDVKEQNGLVNTVFLGDFNENPYDRNMLSANKLHALPCFNDLDREKRIVLNQEYIKYYNPMWNLLGDKDGIPGTYYYNSSELTNPFWHMPDQVVFSKGLYSRFVFEELKIITKTNVGSLIDESGRPNTSISDHLPLVFEIGDDNERV